MSYQFTSNIKKNDLRKKSVLIIGAGYIANEYAYALSKLKIENVTIISKRKKTSREICKKFRFVPIFGGYEKALSNLPKMDLVIVATPVMTLLPATLAALTNGQTNILIEKPGSLDYKDLDLLSKKFPNTNIRIAYNRLSYPNFYLLKKLIDKDGGASGGTVTREDLARMPGRSAASIATTVGGVQSDANGNITSVRGSRGDASYYYIDGIKVRGSTSLPKSAIEEVNVMTGGVPANYGDATGGIISITTRGASRFYFGGIEAVTSGFKMGDNTYGLDNYGYNLYKYLTSI